MDERTAAKTLYMQGWKGTEIASVLGVAEKTVSTWSIKGGWKDERENEQEFMTSATGDLKTVIAHNMRVLTLIAKKQAIMPGEEDGLSIEDLRKRLTPRGDADALNKLFVQLKGKEMDWEKLVVELRKFTEYLESEDTKLAKAVIPYAHAYMNEKRKTA